VFRLPPIRFFFNLIILSHLYRKSNLCAPFFRKKEGFKKKRGRGGGTHCTFSEKKTKALAFLFPFVYDKRQNLHTMSERHAERRSL
jgi:wobble nucleotide-excising tRNase